MDIGKESDISVSDIKTPAVPKLTLLQKIFYGTGCAYELTRWLIILLVLGILVHFYLGTIAIVEGESMEPNYHSGEVVLVDRWSYLFGAPGRGDPAVLRFPGDPEHTKYIKRIIGLPKEKLEIKNGQVYINGQLIQERWLPEGTGTYPNLTIQLHSDDYFLMGDNRSNSSDSRIWGIAPKRVLIGKAWFTLWPLALWGKTEKIE